MNAPLRIALISAVDAAIAPARAALHDALPGAIVWNILDDRLLLDADSRGGLDTGLRARMQRLIGHALQEDTDGVLLTCSLYGSVAQETRATVPVLAPDQAAFDDIADAHYESVLVLASFDGARDDSVHRLQRALSDAGSATRVEGVSVPAAMTATRDADYDALVAALVDACRQRGNDIQAVFLAQYSLAPAGNALQEAIDIPVVSGPKSAAAALRRLLSPRGDR